MGQQPTKPSQPSQPSPEEARLKELDALISQAFTRLNRLRAPASAEQAKGIPDAPGSLQAQYRAAFDAWKQLRDERNALIVQWASRMGQRPQPSNPSPPSCTPLPAAPTQGVDSAALPSSAAGACHLSVEPDTPLGGASSQRGHRSSSSGTASSEDAAVVGTVDRLESAPLLGTEATSMQLAPGLRRRQGHDGLQAL
ncbi:hypothetical protein ABPG75_000795 [Micractinium tetrahymenae]